MLGLPSFSLVPLRVTLHTLSPEPEPEQLAEAGRVPFLVLQEISRDTKPKPLSMKVIEHVLLNVRAEEALSLVAMRTGDAKTDAPRANHRGRLR